VILVALGEAQSGCILSHLLIGYFNCVFNVGSESCNCAARSIHFPVCASTFDKISV